MIDKMNVWLGKKGNKLKEFATDKTAALAATVKQKGQEVVDSAKESWKKIKEASKHDELTMNRVYHAFRRDLVFNKTYGLPGTDGSLFSTVKATIQTQGTFSGLCYRHELSPLSWRGHGIYAFSSIAFVFFMTVSDLGDDLLMYPVVWVSSAFYSKLIYALLACPCIYADPYNEVTSKNQCRKDVERAFNCLASVNGLFIFAAGVAFIVVPLIFGVPSNIARDYFINQLGATLTQDIAMMAFYAWYSYSSDKENFEKEWQRFFIKDAKRLSEETGHDVTPEIPVSYSDLALLARDRHVGTVDPDFRDKWDKWFKLAPSLRGKQIIQRESRAFAKPIDLEDGKYPDSLVAQSSMLAALQGEEEPETTSPMAR